MLVQLNFMLFKISQVLAMPNTSPAVAKIAEYAVDNLLSSKSKNEDE